jgi:hypothetical protein
VIEKDMKVNGDIAPHLAGAKVYLRRGCDFSASLAASESLTIESGVFVPHASYVPVRTIYLLSGDALSTAAVAR